jgi:hypothetical protein
MPTVREKKVNTTSGLLEELFGTRGTLFSDYYNSTKMEIEDKRIFCLENLLIMIATNTKFH